MTGSQFARIRRELGLSAYAWGQLLGYQGERNTIQVQIRDMESGKRVIRPVCADLARMLERHGAPDDLSGDTYERVRMLFARHGVPGDLLFNAGAWPTTARRRRAVVI